MRFLHEDKKVNGTVVVILVFFGTLLLVPWTSDMPLVAAVIFSVLLVAGGVTSIWDVFNTAAGDLRWQESMYTDKDVFEGHDGSGTSRK